MEFGNRHLCRFSRSTVSAVAPHLAISNSSHGDAIGVYLTKRCHPYSPTGRRPRPRLLASGEQPCGRQRADGENIKVPSVLASPAGLDDAAHTGLAAAQGSPLPSRVLREPFLEPVEFPNSVRAHVSPIATGAGRSINTPQIASPRVAVITSNAVAPQQQQNITARSASFTKLPPSFLMTDQTAQPSLRSGPHYSSGGSFRHATRHGVSGLSVGAP